MRQIIQSSRRLRLLSLSLASWMMLSACGIAEMEADCRRKPVTDDMLRCLRDVRGADRDYDAKRERLSTGASEKTSERPGNEPKKAERNGCFKRQSSGEMVCPN